MVRGCHKLITGVTADTRNDGYCEHDQRTVDGNDEQSVFRVRFP